MALALPTSLPVSEIVEIVLAILLAATLMVCVRLESRLKRLRADQHELAGTIQALNGAIAAADGSVAALRRTAKDAGDTLGRQVGTARTLSEELALLFAAGERVATRIETAKMGTAVNSASPRRPAPVEGLRAVR
jgi:Flp pilus assembly protein TadB